MTSVEGYVDTRFVEDSVSSTSGGNQSMQKQANFRTDVFFMTHCYVYHPAFLTLDLGGGPSFQNSTFATSDSETSSKSNLYNFSTRATLFRDKPVTASFFFDHLNPTMSVSPGQVMTQESTRKGFDAAVSGALSPVPVRVSYVATETLGQSAERMVNDRSEQFSLNASRSFGALGSTQLQYQTSHQESQSGVVGLPIQASQANSQGVNLDTRLQFGSERQYDLTNLIALNNRSYELGTGTQPDQKDASFLLDLRTRHSAGLSTYSVTHLSTSKQGWLEAANRSSASGLTWAPDPSIEVSGGLRDTTNWSNQVNVRGLGLDGQMKHTRELGPGNLQLGYGFRYDKRDQQSNAPQASVIDEPVTLLSVTQSALSHPRVVGAIRVKNASNQTLVEGTHYSVVVVGVETRLQRLLAPGTSEGEQVLVSYDYDTGGSYGYSQMDHTFSMNWTMGRFMSVYARQFNSSPQVTSGFATFPLNQVNSQVFGGRADIPVRLGIATTVGGSYEMENRHETISPYRREIEDVYLQTDEPLLGLGNFRVSARRTKVDYELTPQGNNITGYEVRYWARPFFGVDLSAARSFEQDNGGSFLRQRTDDSINAQWRERKLRMTASLLRSRESQGEFERNRFMFQFVARREF